MNKTLETAFITGITGQDGAYLSKLLLEKGYEVHGTFWKDPDKEGVALRALGIYDRIKFVECNLLNYSNIIHIINNIKPDEIYNLAAQSFVAESFKIPVDTAEINAISVAKILEAIRSIGKDIRFYQASSSEMFGKAHETPQTEHTFFHPRSPYAVSKLFAHWITINYREAYKIPACCGILYNHESPLRGEGFVTRKITRGLAEIKAGKRDCLILGNINIRRDWGFAGDYVEGMWLMLQQGPSEFDDYILATGRSHSIRDFVNVAARYFGLNIKWEGTGVDEIGRDSVTGKVIVRIDPALFRPADVDEVVGDASKALKNLGWKPKVPFEELVLMMAKADSRL